MLFGHECMTGLSLAGTIFVASGIRLARAKQAGPLVKFFAHIRCDVDILHRRSRTSADGITGSSAAVVPAVGIRGTIAPALVAFVIILTGACRRTLTGVSVHRRSRASGRRWYLFAVGFMAAISFAVLVLTQSDHGSPAAWLRQYQPFGVIP